MRVTFVLPGRGLYGGIRVVAAYGNMLRERGHDVTIVCMRSAWPRRPGAVLQRVYSDFCTRTGLKRDHLHGFAGELRSARADDIAHVVPAGDLVVATHWLTAHPVFDLPENTGTKCYFLQHYEAHSFDPDKVDATWRLPMRKLVVARWLQELAAQRFDDPTAIHVPNGIDLHQFDAPPRGLHTHPTVGLMYSPAQWKGCDTALAAIEIARRSIPDLHIVLFGASEPDNNKPLPPDTTFHVRPRQEDIAAIYASTDVWLMASETEGFGLPPLEAMACRCPVVVTRCGGPDDYLEDGTNGYFVDVGDADAMARRIVEMVRDPGLWQRFSDAAYATRFRFDVEDAMKGFAEALTSIHADHMECV